MSGAAPRLFIDGDACPVKAESYRVAKRFASTAHVVANRWMDMPDEPSIRLEVVDGGFDAADDWIAERAARGDVVVTDDIPLAARCLARGARVLTTRGEERDAGSIGDALAQRELMQYLRGAGDARRGPKPLRDDARARFARELDRVLRAAQRDR